MPFIPALTDAASRVRYAVGDTTDPSIMPGGEATYAALLLIHAGDEAAAARAAAAGLAAYYATQPDSLSANGESVRWGERVTHWTRIATGAAGGAGASGAAFTLVPADFRGTSATDEYSR